MLLPYFVEWYLTKFVCMCARVTSSLPLLVAACRLGDPFNTNVPLNIVKTKKRVVAGRDECIVAECGDVVSLIVCVHVCGVCACVYVCLYSVCLDVH